MIKNPDCTQCYGEGTVTLFPWTSAPIWEREKEAIEVECSECKGGRDND